MIIQILVIYFLVVAQLYKLVLNLLSGGGSTM